jgi:hypothetical protein
MSPLDRESCHEVYVHRTFFQKHPIGPRKARTAFREQKYSVPIAVKNKIVNGQYEVGSRTFPFQIFYDNAGGYLIFGEKLFKLDIVYNTNRIRHGGGGGLWAFIVDDDGRRAKRFLIAPDGQVIGPHGLKNRSYLHRHGDWRLFVKQNSIRRLTGVELEPAVIEKLQGVLPFPYRRGLPDRIIDREMAIIDPAYQVPDRSKPKKKGSMVRETWREQRRSASGKFLSLQESERIRGREEQSRQKRSESAILIKPVLKAIDKLKRQGFNKLKRSHAKYALREQGLHGAKLEAALEMIGVGEEKPVIREKYIPKPGERIVRNMWEEPIDPRKMG